MNRSHIPQARRAPSRPLIMPRRGETYWWESKGTFNPGVTEYRGKIVLLYRAYDEMYISRLGYAESTDGIHFLRRDRPAVDTDPDDPFERIGVEDPRITKIGDTYYILHTSASLHALGTPADVPGGMRNYIPWRIRIGMHTTKNFRQFRRYGLILPNVVGRNATVLPEQYKGSFGLYYREGLRLRFSLTNNFRRWTGTRTIAWPQRASWESMKFGTGSQPIAFPEGYLMVTHGVDQAGIYRLGLVLFDRQKPWKIRWKTGPILEPERPYEKKGFIPNVVYTCGALRRGTDLWVYYGAADAVIARAILPLNGIVSL